MLFWGLRLRHAGASKSMIPFLVYFSEQGELERGWGRKKKTSTQSRVKETKSSELLSPWLNTDYGSVKPNQRGRLTTPRPCPQHARAEGSPSRPLYSTTNHWTETRMPLPNGAELRSVLLSGSGELCDFYIIGTGLHRPHKPLGYNTARIVATHGIHNSGAIVPLLL